LSYTVSSWLPFVPPVDDDAEEMLSKDLDAKFLNTLLIDETLKIFFFNKT
jgi:hypothetical protein